MFRSRQRGHQCSRYADDGNLYIGSQAAGERVKGSIQGWIEQHLRLQGNATQSGVGRVWERKFLGFRPEPRHAEGSGSGEFGAIPNEGAGEVAELPESDE